MSGHLERTARITSTNLSTVDPTSPTTPLVSDTAFTSEEESDSSSIPMILSVERCLSSEGSSSGELQKAHLYMHLGSRLKNACSGQCLTTGTISTLGMNCLPLLVRDSLPLLPTTSSNSPDSRETVFFTRYPSKANTADPNPAPGPAVECDILQGGSKPSGSLTAPPRVRTALRLRASSIWRPPPNPPGRTRHP